MKKILSLIMALVIIAGTLVSVVPAGAETPAIRLRYDHFPQHLFCKGVGGSHHALDTGRRGRGRPQRGGDRKSAPGHQAVEIACALQDLQL